MKFFKKAVVILLCLIFSISACTVVYSANSSAKLYSFYTNNMLFKQNEKATLAGTAKKGDKIAFALYNSKNKIIASGEQKVSNNGKFELSFNAPNGSYEEYSIVMTANTRQFDKLTKVVFGELWLASGQSNMELKLNTSSTWTEFVNNSMGNKWVRVMLGASRPNGDDPVPLEGQEDCPGSKWVTGKDVDVGEASACGYYFAQKLQEELNVPVGILNISMGSTWIRSWLPRQAIENDEQVLNILKRQNAYVSADEYDKNNTDMLSTIAANYNLKIYPVRRFKLSGMIWYQGENDLMYGALYGEYTAQLELLQKSYTKTFSYSNGLLPIVYSQAASSPYHTTQRELQDYNSELSEFQAKDMKTRAMITLYDLPLEYSEITYVYHPWVKKPVGERMTQCALGLVYKRSGVYTASSLESSKSDGKYIFMKFRNVGEGLKVNGDVLYGFLVCGKDGVYYKANAQIVSENTVKVWNDDIMEPAAATYAFSQENSRSSLYSTKNGQLYMPVSASITDRNIGTVYSSDYVFMDCDQEMYWRDEGHMSAGYFDIWNTQGCTYCVVPESAYSGTNGLKVVNSKINFELRHVIFDTSSNSQRIRYYETNSNWSKYGSLSFKVRNTGKNAVAFNCIKLKADSFKWYEAAFRGEGIIPADGQWHTITVELNNLSLFSFGTGFANALKDVCELDVSFTGKIGSCIDVDNFEFSPKKADKIYLTNKMSFNVTNLQRKLNNKLSVMQ